MKKTYLIPTIKTMCLPELMQAPVTGSEIDPNEFDPSAKDMDMDDDDFGGVFHPKSVWDD